MKCRTLGALVAAATLAFAALPLRARPGATPDAAPSAVRLALGRMRLAIERDKLESGLRVVLDRDTTTPTVAVGMLYRCGARDETAGHGGAAHLLAEMTFEGSQHLQPGQLRRLVAARGGRATADVDHDRTLFLDELPANELALGLWVEAERMQRATLPASRFAAVRSSAEAGARRLLSAPLSHAELRLSELAFQGLPPYSRPAAGAPDELAHAGIAWVKGLYRRCYAPDNAVLVVAGSFDPTQAIKLVHRYFDDIPRSKHARKPARLHAPRQTSERVSVFQSHGSAALFNAWVIPAPHSSAHAALELLARVFGDGESSRLYNSLVRVHHVARDVSAWTAGRHGPDLLTLRVLLADGADPDRVQKLVDAELGRLRRHGPDAAELEKARALDRTQWLLGLQSNRQRAARLAEAEAFGGGARALVHRLDSFESVTRSAVASAAAKYLTRPHRTTVELQGPEKGGARHHSTHHHSTHHHSTHHHSTAKHSRGASK